MIIFDLKALQPHKSAPVHGGGVFAEYVLRRMILRNIDFMCIYDSSLEFPQNIQCTLNEKNITIVDIHNSNIADLNKGGRDTIFSILPEIAHCCKKCVGTIHDCREMETPYDWFYFLYPFSIQDGIRELMCRLFSKLRTKKHIEDLSLLYNHPNFFPTTITEYSKERLAHYYPNKRFQNIKIFRTPFADYGATIEKNNKKGGYLLMVSGNRPVKNVLRALIAFDRLVSSHKISGIRAVVTGVNRLNFFKYRFKNPTLIETLGYVSNEKLTDLYRHAYAFIFPSLYEGFGIPPLEAMRVGTPVLAAADSAIPEVCGDAALYFDPFSIEEIQNQITTILNDNEKYRDLQEKGFKNYNNLKAITDEDLDNYIDYAIEVDKH